MTHEMLNLLDEALNGLPSFVIVPAAGQSWKFRMLQHADETAAKALIPDDFTIMQAMVDGTTAQLAYALVSLNDVPVDELFPPTGDSPMERSVNQRTEILEWLNAKPEVLTKTLWAGYWEHKREYDRQMSELPSFLAETPSGS